MKLPTFVQDWRHTKRHSRAYLFHGRVRVSTVGLLVAFAALYWVNQNFEPKQPATPEQSQIVPPGFVPDPNYTWVPRTNVRTREPETTTPTTTTTTETSVPTTTSPGETTSPTSPEEATPATPTTTVIDPDGPGGPLGPQTFTQAPPTLAPTTVTTPGPVPATTPQSSR